ncbi:unnamed protein product [Dibothriocephalus latus]|uniref:BAH domain-containing protein n=1 Tax=Dibothriocephalus latus TaxID=60516 RepID=A0A3P7NQZ8_DIBLA|nr:unnamed protein product [Dibothriocephalus latus]
MVVSTGDNVLLCSGPNRHNAPHVAKVTALFPDSETGTKMMALMWYYRPESLTPPRRNCVESELFASRHCDVNPVDCIEDRAYVLSAAAFARFMAITKYKEECRKHWRAVLAVPPRRSSEGSPEYDYPVSFVIFGCSQECMLGCDCWFAFDCSFYVLSRLVLVVVYLGGDIFQCCQFHFEHQRPFHDHR